MKCPVCNCIDSKVIDSRLSEDGRSIRRRRECVECGKRFTTYETMETPPVYVVKKSGVREEFNVNKLKNGILRACEKRPVSITVIDDLVSKIERKVYNMLDQEVPSQVIGDMVMQGLKEIDDVAYVRFSAVYKEFRDVETWFNEMEEFLQGKQAQNKEIK